MSPQTQTEVYNYLVEKYWHGSPPSDNKQLFALTFLTSLAISNADEYLSKKPDCTAFTTNYKQSNLNLNDYPF